MVRYWGGEETGYDGEIGSILDTVIADWTGT